MRIAIFSEPDIKAIQSACDAMTGCADHISQSYDDEDTANEIDTQITAIGSVVDHAISHYDADDIIEHWVTTMCDEEIKNANDQMRQENLWALGSATVEQSKMHVQNIVRLEQYRLILSSIKSCFAKEVNNEIPI